MRNARLSWLRLVNLRLKLLVLLLELFDSLSELNDERDQALITFMIRNVGSLGGRVAD